MRGIPLLQVEAPLKGRFLERMNRFLARVELEGEEVAVHVHDPGRLRELLWSGNRVLLRPAGNRRRKTRYDLMAAWCRGSWVLVHSGTHRALAEALLRSRCSPIGGISGIRAEVRVGASRIDFRLDLADGASMLLETKGCTLCAGNRALFPDAPTQRGRRHLEELMEAMGPGVRAGVLILITCPGAACFAPNGETDPAFATTFWRAVEQGVEVFPVSISYDGRWLYYEGEIPVCRDVR